MAVHAAKRPQPVISTATIVGALHTLSALLVYFGASSAGAAVEDHRTAIAGAILFAAPYVAAVVARRKVTPKSSPQTDAGERLVPAGSTPATVNAAAVLARAQAIDAAEVPEPGSVVFTAEGKVAA